MTSKKIKELITLGSSNTLAPIINGLFWLFIASILAKIEYGELGYLFSIVNVGSAVSILGLGVVVIVYESKKENVFPPALIVVLISSSLSAIIAFLLTENFFVSFLIVGLAVFTLTLNGLISKQKYHTYSINQIIKASSAVVLALLFYQFFGINGILIGYIFSVLFILIQTFSLLKNKKIEISVLKPKIRFMLQAYSARILSVVFWWGDKIVIGSMFGFTFLAGYYFATQYLILLESIPKTINQFLLPQEAIGLKNRNIKIYSIVLVSVIALASILLVPIGVNILLPKFQESIVPMQIMSLALIPLSISAIYETEYLGRENSLVFLTGSSIQVLSYFLLIFILGQSLGLIGIAFGFLIGASLKAGYNFIMRLWINPNSKAGH